MVPQVPRQADREADHGRSGIGHCPQAELLAVVDCPPPPSDRFRRVVVAGHRRVGEAQLQAGVDPQDRHEENLRRLSRRRASSAGSPGAPTLAGATFGFSFTITSSPDPRSRTVSRRQPLLRKKCASLENVADVVVDDQEKGRGSDGESGKLPVTIHFSRMGNTRRKGPFPRDLRSLRVSDEFIQCLPRIPTCASPTSVSRIHRHHRISNRNRAPRRGHRAKRTHLDPGNVRQGGICPLAKRQESGKFVPGKRGK